MPRAPQYILLFIITALVQLLMLDNLSLSVYLHPMLYLAAIVLLPIEMAPIWVLLVALTMGALMDIGSGSAALNTITLLFGGFARPLLLRLGVDRDEMREGGGAPSVARMGRGGFARYVIAIALCHCTLYFLLEAASWNFLHLTALRIAISTSTTVALIYLCELFFRGR